jgi:hypothetical protein
MQLPDIKNKKVLVKNERWNEKEISRWGTKKDKQGKTGQSGQEGEGGEGMRKLFWKYIREQKQLREALQTELNKD